MPKFAPVAPIQVLEGLWAAGPQVFGDYHLLLAHHTVEHGKRFRDLFRRAEDAEWSGTIIMDNSIVELGDSVSSDMVAEAVGIIQEEAAGSVVYPVLPDVMGNGIATREIVVRDYVEWTQAMPNAPFMVVVQGTDFDDYQESLEFFTGGDFPAIEILGIPRILHKTCGSRVHAMRNASEYAETYKIHMLGFSDNITDDVDSACIILDCGIDSAVPLRTREVFTEFLDAGKRPPTWFDTAQVDTRMIENLEAARKLFLRDAQAS